MVMKREKLMQRVDEMGDFMLMLMWREADNTNPFMADEEVRKYLRKRVFKMMRRLSPSERKELEEAIG